MRVSVLSTVPVIVLRAGIGDTLQDRATVAICTAVR
jgi:hypothetical protein